MLLHTNQRRALLLVVLALASLSAACSRTRYRLNADRQVNALVTEKAADPRWAIRDFNLNMDPRSRYFDPYNPDREPMPPDDPAAHVFMHYVDGMRGYRKWHINGQVQNLQNPGWRERLTTYMPVTADGAMKLDLADSIRLAYIHSPDYRTQLETLYLSALDVSTERFRFAVQFYGGFGPTFLHQGSAASATGTEQNTLTTTTTPQVTSIPGYINTGPTTNPAPQAGRLQFQKNLATGGQVLVGFANSFVWQFAGPDTNTTNSLLNFNIVQPLLRAGGRAVALEQLTISERTLLSNLRAMMRYRQGFFTNVAVGDFSGITGPQRVGGFSGGTGLTGFSGQGSGGLGGVGQATNFGRAGFSAPTAGTGAVAGGTGFAGGGAGALGGFVGLLQQLQQIRNTRDSLNLQLRTLALLEANFEAGLIDAQQVDTFRQNIETERANLLQSEIALENSKDTFKRQIIGLPPDIPLELDDSMIEPFRLIDPDVRAVESELSDFIDVVGRTQAEPPLETFGPLFDELAGIRPKLAVQFAEVKSDLEKMEATAPTRLKLVEAADRPALEADFKRLHENLAQLQARFEAGEGELDRLRAQLGPGNRAQSANALVALAGSLSTMTQELSLVQARARLETIVIEPIELTSEQALDIARAARQDWMNNRATVVNTWRLITFNANALKSNLTVTFSGDLGTTGNNAVNFNGNNGTLQAGLRFDPPFTRLLERNNYRQSLISYQQDRRTLIQFEDGINQQLRQDLRVLGQLAKNLEIQRRAVAIAVRRVDKTLEDLNQPPAPVQPGQQAVQLGPTAAFNLLTAISDMRNAQNNFLSVWLNFYSERVQLQRDLGVMQVDENGLWIDLPLGQLLERMNELNLIDMPEPLPPAVPQQWLDEAGVNRLGGAVEEGFEPLQTPVPTPQPNPPMLPIPPSIPVEQIPPPGSGADRDKNNSPVTDQARLVLYQGDPAEAVVSDAPGANANEPRSEKRPHEPGACECDEPSPSGSLLRKWWPLNKKRASNPPEVES